MKGRALRTWIGRLNVGLALAAAVVWTHAARAPSGAPDAGEFDATLEVAPPASSARPWSEAEWVALVRRFHGPPRRPASARTPAGDDAAFVAGPLPLPMYRIAVLLRVPDGPDTVRLASKDRRRPSNVDLVEGEVVEGISIGWIRDVGEGVEVEIRRGDETFVLVHGDRAPPPLRIVAAAAEPPGRELGAGGGPAMSGAAADDPGLRLVPWRGPDGDLAGCVPDRNKPRRKRRNDWRNRHRFAGVSRRGGGRCPGTRRLVGLRGWAAGRIGLPRRRLRGRRLWCRRVRRVVGRSLRGRWAVGR